AIGIARTVRSARRWFGQRTLRIKRIRVRSPEQAPRAARFDAIGGLIRGIAPKVGQAAEADSGGTACAGD
ncbi:hypothetical protein, partial [Dokdonella sp.]|uniref:hypothetical protein n=1 Tax=Dokdonella sp. TaxID=2291710 RepID=UPI003BB0F7BB